MSESTNKKPISAPKVVPMMSKIMEDKLTGPNYLDWSKTIHLYLRSICMASHLTEEVVTLINHCEFVKELMNYLEFVYSGKGNISRIFDVCRAFYCSEKQDQSLTEFFMDYKKTYEELNVLVPFSQDVKVHQDQWENMAVMGFIAALPYEYDFFKTHILSSSEVSSFQETFSQILYTEISLHVLPSTQMSSALVG